MLGEKNVVVTENEEIADTINKYFVTVTENLGLKRNLIRSQNPWNLLIRYSDTTTVFT